MTLSQLFRLSTRQPVVISPAFRVLPVTWSRPYTADERPAPVEERGIYVKNLPWKTSWDEVALLFSEFGQVLRLNLPRAPNDKGRGEGLRMLGHAFVNMQKEDAFRAVDKLNGFNFKGRTLHVSLTRSLPKVSTDRVDHRTLKTRVTSYGPRPGKPGPKD
ncbi:hypothetical protein IWQ60_001662 [Tieghemiomyces parasiticus]|uniref:RRM domain-containing protein n=1 Tax=Tieghemiomyces parasiticus TaxID=78921 RepID=A0A9W8AGK6_9FUNG|nr:hypothetical protein IWQ60_001662 [Tieghemiomyces parasiticus]